MQKGVEDTLIFKELSKSWKAGACELCGKHTPHLERHHVRYRPERTLDICHKCHHTIHFWPDRVPDDYIVKLMMVWVNPYMRYMYIQNPERLLSLYHSLVERGKQHGGASVAPIYAPSRSVFLEQQRLAAEAEKRKEKRKEKKEEKSAQAGQERESESVSEKSKVLTNKPVWYEDGTN